MLARRKFCQDGVTDREVAAHTEADQNPKRKQFQRRCGEELKECGNGNDDKTGEKNALAAKPIRQRPKIRLPRKMPINAELPIAPIQNESSGICRFIEASAYPTVPNA